MTGTPLSGAIGVLLVTRSKQRVRISRHTAESSSMGMRRSSERKLVDFDVGHVARSVASGRPPFRQDRSGQHLLSVSIACPVPNLLFYPPNPPKEPTGVQ